VTTLGEPRAGAPGVAAANPRGPDVRFLLAHPAHFVALGFGAGLAPFAPGTFGTLLAIPLAAWLETFAPPALFIAAVAALGALGVWAAGRTARDLGAPDHGAIVWDETVAFLLVLFFVGDDLVRIAFAFALFRAFDILKPPPIRHVDATLEGGTGVMLDDLVAAGYTLLVLALWQRLFG
jgi:phosphatidylglycerophosphatase A